MTPYRYFFTAILFSFSSSILVAQTTTQDLVKNFRWRSIGPSVMAGRVSDIEAVDNNFAHVFVASASGGVWKSTGAGTTWEPIFEDYGSTSIGDIALFQPDPNIIWVGTGEANNRNSSGWGDGIYKSVDGGETFTNMGLRETHKIARIFTHPTNKDIVYVAAIGHLWGYSGERGLYKTIDGGNTWQKLTNGLPDDGKTGATDIIINPNAPNTLLVAMYERIRKPWSFLSGGANGGIFKSTDGGASWKKLTKGLPTGDTGRIGLDFYRKNPNIIMAAIEADENLPDDMTIPGPGVYRSEDGGESWQYLFRHSSRPFYFGQIRINPSDDQLVYLLYRDFRMSRDGGKTFGRGFSGIYGDPHAMWIDPDNKNVMYFGDDGGAHLSLNGGQSWKKFDNMAIGQYYAIGTDMRDPYWVYGGLQDQNVWGVPSNSRDGTGILNEHTFNVSGGDGFHAQIDPTDWRTVYSVAHVGYAGRQNIETRERKFITPTPETIVNFDEYAQVDYNETPIVYTIDPGEYWLWFDMADRSIKGNILPAHFRFNWNSPLVISPNNPRKIYFGSNYLFVSYDRGDSWRIISPDLTTNDPAKRNPSGDGGLTVDVTGAENHCTILTISESHRNEGVIWVGTDDGNVQVTRDGGATWYNATMNIPDVPRGLWVSRVEASHFDESVAYVSYDGHRSDNFKPYIFKTTDFGSTWTNISANIPDGNSVHVVKEDTRNPNLLVAGTEFSTFITLDGGESWASIKNNMPTVAVRDIVIHPREGDIVAGTHGRSLYIMDDITPLQQLTDKVLAKDVHLFENKSGTKWQRISRGGHRGHFLNSGQNPPSGAFINFYLGTEPASNIEISIKDTYSTRQQILSINADAGINKVRWDMQFDPTDDEIQNFKEHLAGMIGHFEKMTLTPSEKEQLTDIKGRLTRGNTIRALNGVRSRLMNSFAKKESAISFWGEILERTPAREGEYTFTLTINGNTHEGKIAVRDDPILKK